jgi:hypothetical protein
MMTMKSSPPGGAESPFDAAQMGATTVVAEVKTFPALY